MREGKEKFFLNNIFYKQANIKLLWILHKAQLTGRLQERGQGMEKCTTRKNCAAVSKSVAFKGENGSWQLLTF